MKPILPTIHPRETGPQVANLQDALLALLAGDKIWRVDAPNRPTPEELEILSVGIRRERARSYFDEATYNLVVTFQVQQVPNDNLKGVVEDTTALKLNELLEFIGALDEETSLIVRGTVTTADGQPISGASVIIFDRDLRKEQKFGKAETDARGKYIISSVPANFASGDVPSAPIPKLIVRAFKGGQQIGDDVSRPHPAREEVVDFKTSAPMVSEWEKHTIIMPLLEGQGDKNQALDPWELNDGDLNFIAEETGLEREKIRLWALAFTVSHDAEAATPPVAVTSAIFYGWFRLGLPTEPSALWSTPTDKLLATVRAAIAQGIVPSNIDDGLSTRIEQIKSDRVLRAPALGTRATLRDLLATLPTSLNLDQQRAIAAATDLRPDDPKLVERIKRIAGFEDDALAVGVTHSLRLGVLTAGHLPLAHALQSRLQLAGENKGTLLPLTALRPDEWLDLAYTHGAPDGYADALAASIERQYPTAALAAHLSDGRRLAQQPILANVGMFLRDNPDFDIETANLYALPKDTKFGGLPEPKQEQLVTGLRAIQRMRLLTASLDETATLFEYDLYSPHQLLAAGPGQLSTLLDGQIAPERVAALYSQVEELHTVTLGAFTAALSPLSGPRIMPNEFGIPGGGDPINPDDLGGVGQGTILPNPFPEDDGSNGSTVLKEVKDLLASGRRIDPRRALTLLEPERPLLTPVFRDEAHWRGEGASVLDANPTLQTLFGSQDACACGHCSSVLGPAAYFVDVLQFINEANLLNRILDLKRRPDLQDLELSCNNTNTVVPSIDLALEILENAVALPFDVRLPDGTNVDEQLVSGQLVGAAVRDALEETVRNLSGEVRATLTRSHGDGTTDWTVIDGHRRWTLTAQPETILKATRADNGAAHMLDMAGLKPPELIATLDQKRIPKGAEPAFARLFAPHMKQPPDFANYDEVTVTPSKVGHSWDVTYRFVTQLRIDTATNQLVLRSKDRDWSENRYNQKTIEAAEQDLAKTTVPKLVHLLVASRFSDTRKLHVSAIESGHKKEWTIASERPRLTLTVVPARLTITSLAYQSGDPKADALAWPENHNPAAYIKLKGEDAVFPWSLPVDLPLEEVRLFLERARSSRRRLIELMLPVDERMLDDTGVTLPSAQNTREDTPLVFSKKHRNAITLSSERGDTVTITISVTKGVLNVRANPEVGIRDNDTESVIIRGTHSAINRALDGMTFTPSPDYNGEATLTIAAAGEPGLVVVSVPLTIAPMADIADDTAATEENAPIIIPVLANDTFENIGHRITLIDGLAITANGPVVNVTHGTVALDISGRLIFMPARDYNGPASFNYTVSSGGVEESATVYVAINSANLDSFALEVLGLSMAEAKLIAPTAPPSDTEIHSYWGLSPTATNVFDAASGRTLEGTSPLALLKNVSVLLQQSRLSFEELQTVLGARFVTQDGKAPLRIEPQTTCKPSEMWLPALTTGHLDRLHRFIRLWRKLGWTMRDLDLAIQAFGGQLTPDTLTSLSRLQRLKQQLDVPLTSIIGGLGSIETRPWTDHLTEGAPVHPSLYASIFQREAVRAVSDFAAFALGTASPPDLENKPVQGISDHANYIGACLRIKSSVIADWVSDTVGLGIVDKLDLANLSRLTAAADLCRGLGIDPDKFAQHLKMYGAPFPFQSGMSAHDRAEAMLQFIERFRSVKQLGVDVETLSYLLKHEITPGSNVDLDAKQLKQLSSAARDAVRSILDAPVKIRTLPLTQAEAEADAKVTGAIRLAREDAAIAALATGLGGTRELVDELLRNRLRHPSDPIRWGIDALLDPAFTTSDVSHSPTAAVPPGAVLDPVVKTKVDAADKAVEQVLVRLHKTLLICHAMKLSRTDLSLLRASTTHPHGFTVLDLNSLPVASGDAPTSITGFEQLLALTQLRGLASNAGDLLHEYAALTFPPNLPVVWKEIVGLGGQVIRIPEGPRDRWHPGAAHQVLMTGLTLTEAEVKAAAQQLRISTAEHYRNPMTLTRLINLLIELKQLGATVEQARDLTAPSPSDAAAISARELLRSKYGESQWHNLIKPIADKLRERQRNALVDYLVARKGLRGADDLYERYLIDVQTSSCLKTTRLLQATAAAQLFVQRVLLNLENDASLSEDKRKRWDWMRSYRVWEANRNVFLFPNWLLPELRDDKTAIFRQMESALTDQEPSSETTRTALLGYLDELSDLSQISVIAMYEDSRLILVGVSANQTPQIQSTLYVVGRTPNQPYRYFWRSCAEFGYTKMMSWSGWEALDLENANDFIMPFVMEGDLHIAWPIFRKTTDRENRRSLRWEITIAWQRRTAKGWTKRKLGHETLSFKRLREISELRSFVFQVRKDEVPVPTTSNLHQDRITIDCYAAEEIPNHPLDYGEKVEDLKKPVYGKSRPQGNKNNVHLTMSGQVWEKYKLKPDDNDYIFRPAETVAVELVWSVQRGEGGSDQYSSTCNVDPSGNFSFTSSQTYQLDSVWERFGSPLTKTAADLLLDPGVHNGGKVVLTFSRNDQVLKLLTGNIFDRDDKLDGNRLDWRWDPLVVFEILRPEDDPYLFDREVKFNNASGCFVLTASLDMEILAFPQPPPTVTPKLGELVGIERLGNRFDWTEKGHVVKLAGDGDLSVDGDFGPRVQITSVTVPSRNSPEIWYLQDATVRYYVRRKIYGWDVYPDGQDFVQVYRSIAAASTFQLFDPATQGMRRDSPQTLLPPSPPNSTTSPTISFDRTRPYANYNWELFLHAPLAIADCLASHQRFADARLWLHAVFDPTRPLSNGLPQFWRFLPFDNATKPDSIAKLLIWLANPEALTAEARTKFEDDFGHQIDEWKKNPFMPHVIARLRPSAYQWHTFFAYLDVLIGWGDQLFRRDTRESVNEATLLYVLAAKLLGPRPRVIPPPTPPPPQTYRSLRANKLDEFGNVWVHYADHPVVRRLVSAQTGSLRSSQSFTLQKSDGVRDHVPVPIPDKSGIQLLTSLSSLAFCIPQNEKVTEFYDRIENRLFNVRNCRNIEGVFRDLPLYEPPIDPLLLIRARAAGLDIDDVLDNFPLPNYRFSFTLQKALELSAELKALGGALLTALEKKDAEELTLLRSRHEIALLKLVLDTRKQQIAEAEANIAALQQSEVTILERFGQYQKLLGKPSITNDRDGLPVVEQSSSLAVSTDSVGEGSGLGLIRKEVDQLILSGVANILTQAANSGHVMAGVLSLIPETWVGGVFAGVSFGGSNLGGAASAIAKAIEMHATEASFFANLMGTFAGYERRQDEWVHQSKLALAELKQIQKQILAAEIRKSMAKHELENHDTQIQNAEKVDEFLHTKFTSQQLYSWMVGQISNMYFCTYQLALDQARRAERTYQHELCLDSKVTPFVQAGRWDRLKEGLLAGEHLHHDLKRMEGAYLERNVREFEITKHISLLQLDPVALITLRQTNTCEFKLPEVLFDLDYPGHYMRRIKMVSLSIPCVAGPYASVSATLRLIKNEIRANQLASGTYERHQPESEEDSRFVTTAATITAVVTSSAQQDSGMFEPNLRDERYLPFEGAGVISTWRIELPSEFHAFDYDTIADVVLHVRYTARYSDDLKTTATASGGILSAINSIKMEASKTGMARLFSLRQEFPAEWHQLINGNNPDLETGNQSQVFPITKSRFPFLFTEKHIKISSLDLYAVPKVGVKISALPALTVTPPNNVNATWNGASEIGRLRGKTLTLSSQVEVEDETANWKMEIPKAIVAGFQKDIHDILIFCRYSLSTNE